MIVEVLPAPVMVVDDRHRLVLANGEARRLLANDNIKFVGYSVGRFLSLEKLESARVTLLSRAGVHSYRDSILVEGVERAKILSGGRITATRVFEAAVPIAAIDGAAAAAGLNQAFEKTVKELVEWAAENIGAPAPSETEKPDAAPADAAP
jgi:hypothetical protein